MFKNTLVEVMMINDVPYFNPYHVGTCLGLSNSTVRDYVAVMNDKQVIKLKNSDVDNLDIRKLNNAGENFLTESGLYKLMFKSNKKQAEEFQDWVTDEVLPQIRQTGMYLSQKERLQLDLFSDDKLTVVQAHKQLVQLETIPLLEQLEEQKEDVKFSKAIGDCQTLITITELANILKQNGVNIGGKRLFDWLRNNGYLVKQQGKRRNLPTQKSLELGVLQLVEKPYPHPNGNMEISKTAKVTPKGQKYFIQKFLNGSV